MKRFSVESCVRGYSVGAHIPGHFSLLFHGEREVLAPFVWSCFCLLHFSVHFLNHHTRDSLKMETLWIKGTVNGAQVAKKSHDKTSPVRILACVDSTAVWVESFVGGKFCDAWVNHENKEN